MNTTIYNSAIALLARRDHSKKELKTKLERKYGCNAEIGEIISLLEEKGYISEARYARSMVNHNASITKKGPVAIKNMLEQNGIDKEIAKEALSEISDEQWVDMAAKILDRRFPNKTSDNNKKTRFLAQRGFNYNHIKKAIQLTEKAE